VEVSVIIPAHNASATLAESLNSLQAQTFRDWEAIVVDDGSTDATLAIAESFAQLDARIHAVRQPPQGVSTARNNGVREARFDWILFLDADDWLLPSHLKRLTDTLRSESCLDAVHCGWVFVGPEGKFIGERYCIPHGNLFEAFARYCAVAIHACIVRRSLVEAVGGFDASLRTCEDWDLWQRIVRSGARFGMVHEVLACYRIRPNSASLNARQMLADGMRVIIQGHRFDPRVHNPEPRYAPGLPLQQLAGAKFHFACWTAGLSLGRGEDPRPLLSTLSGEREPDLSPNLVAWQIFEASRLSKSRSTDSWVELWPELERPVNDFLLALENHATASGLARRARTALERLILNHRIARQPLTVGSAYAIRVDLSEPIPDIVPPGPAERLHCSVDFEGEKLGTLELPVFEGVVPRYVLADALAAEFAWKILYRFFRYTIFEQLDAKKSEKGLSVWRGSLMIADGLVEDDDNFHQSLFDQAGWTLFLQELWGRPDWSLDRFYNPELVVASELVRNSSDGWLEIEVNQEIPNVHVSGNQLKVIPRIGKSPIGVVICFVDERNMVPAQRIRAVVTKQCGFELCRVAVREGLFGTSIAKPIFLRKRLEQRSSSGFVASNCSMGTVETLFPGLRGLVLARRLHCGIDTSASRRAVLPNKAWRDLADVAETNGEPLTEVAGNDNSVECVVYAPEVIDRSCALAKEITKSRDEFDQFKTVNPRFHDRSTFETLFAPGPDPWKYSSPYEKTKYEHTLSLLPPGKIESALELACAEGHFTAQLAPCVGNLLATDISQIALGRAAHRCAALDNIRFVQLDFTKDALPGRFDLIVCSEVLYYVGGRTELEAVAYKLAGALNPGGSIVLAHANLVVDDPDRPGFDWDHPFGAKVIGETFANIASLAFVKELRLPLYRVQRFTRYGEGDAKLQVHIQQTSPQILDMPQQVLPEANYASRILWHGGEPRRESNTQAIVTNQLPILVYHAVAPGGPAGLARYRVTPKEFEEQLSYLRDAGYYGIRLEEWHAAMIEHKPLSGRAVLITFDDGYLDFLTCAWPLLKQYGFSATVFLVAGRVGGSNRWDDGYGEPLPLLGWNDIRRLRGEGIDFGSHSTNHPLLTALSPTQVVCEAARSRAILQRELGEPVSAFAYPYGDEDHIVQHIIGACGYTFGLTCRSARAGLWESLLALPRIEILGSDNFRDFVLKLNL
jgi:peptidoglycan/xylan/chitin deacetylase (PgdA/CDA1 family)/GT2 family glycosyltransferase/2-polyprenyl-3-methyl-5-hydroxy-6-metoxy-1,4-benzoquinol methylase